jgi:hypothetical protein
MYFSVLKIISNDLGKRQKVLTLDSGTMMLAWTIHYYIEAAYFTGGPGLLCFKLAWHFMMG